MQDVPVVGGSDDDGVDVGACAKLAEVEVCCAAGGVVSIVDGFLGSFAVGLFDVTDGEDVGVFEVEEVAQQGAAAAAG